MKIGGEHKHMVGQLLGALPLFDYWHLLLLLVIVSLVFGATRCDDWGDIAHESWRWFLRLTMPMVIVFLVFLLLWRLD